MIRRPHLVLVIGCIAAAVFLLRYSVDREFINLSPTLGAQYVVPLKAGVTYELQFIARHSPITRLGFFLKPLQENLPSGSVMLEVRQEDQVLAHSSVTAPFIDAQGFTQWRIAPPLAIIPGEPVQVQLTVTEALNEKIGLLQRQSDETFTGSDAVFSIAGVRQANPIAHQAYFAYRPALALHSSGLLLLAAVALVLPHSLKRYAPPAYALALAAVAFMPVLRLNIWPVWALLAVAISWWGMFRLLRQQGVSVIPAGIGAHAASLTTYFALHVLAGQNNLALLSLLPLVFSFTKKPVAQITAITLLLTAIIPELTKDILPVASLRDIWLDPNQAVQALKIAGSELRWWHFGSYVGVLGALLASVGLVTQGKKYWRLVSLLIVSLLMIQVIGPRLLPTGNFFIPWAYLIIIPTYALAYFIGLGANSLQRYLGWSRAGTVILGWIGLVALLDLLYVFSTTIESFYL